MHPGLWPMLSPEDVGQKWGILYTDLYYSMPTMHCCMPPE
jgi:hypothetical protein